MNKGMWLIGTIAMLFALTGCSDDGAGPSDNEATCGLSTTLLEFGSVAVGHETTMTFTIENTGEDTLSGTVTETSDDFLIVGEASYSLDADASDTFTVRFMPTSLGDKTCAMETGSSRCGSLQCTGTGGAHYYVDAASGLDTNPGTSEEPFKTITHAVSVVGSDSIIGVLPGTYNTALGETFPITLKQGQMLIGDIPNKGLGAAATAIYGSGDVSSAQYDDNLAAIVGADMATVTGFDISAPYKISTFGIYAADAAMTISDNSFTSTITSLYGGIRVSGNGATVITHNDFLTSAYGVYSAVCTGGMLISENDFQTMTVPVDLTGAANNTVICGNTFEGSGQNGIRVRDGHPLIEDNIFNKPGGYRNSGAIFCWSETANPTIRRNTFICVRGIHIDSALSPDMGTADDPGENDFTGITAVSINHSGTAALVAIGNTWPHNPPFCGGDIVVDTGTVKWGTGADEECP